MYGQTYQSSLGKKELICHHKAGPGSYGFIMHIVKSVVFSVFGNEQTLIIFSYASICCTEKFHAKSQRIYIRNKIFIRRKSQRSLNPASKAVLYGAQIQDSLMGITVISISQLCQRFLFSHGHGVIRNIKRSINGISFLITLSGIIRKLYINILCQCITAVGAHHIYLYNGISVFIRYHHAAVST